MTTDPAQRERDATGLLDAWPWHLGGIIIGGYVNAVYGRLRYSNDLDFLIPAATVDEHLHWLHERDFHDERVPEDLEQNYMGRTARLRRGDLTIDLLPGGVMDRDARVHLPQDWLAQDPVMARLVLYDASTKQEVPVCRPAAFWALKLQAGRLQDLADLFGTMDTAVDIAEVSKLFASFDSQPLRAKLAKVAASLEDPKVMHDVMSRSEAGSPSKRENQRRWQKFEARVNEVVAGIDA